MSPALCHYLIVISSASLFEEGCLKERLGSIALHQLKLQAHKLQYDILPPTTATVDYAIGLEKLSANKQFLDDDKTAFVTDNSKNLLDVSFITDHVAYASTNKTKIV